jgi:hypothetical protein
MSVTAAREQSVNKSFRTTEEVKTLVTRLAALQGLHEGELLDAMVDAYLLVHSPTFAHAIPQAAAVVSARPQELKDAIERFRAFLATNFKSGAQLPTVTQLPSGRERLRARRAEMSAR